MQTDDLVCFSLYSGYSFHLVVAEDDFYVGRRAAYPLLQLYLELGNLVGLYKAFCKLPVAPLGDNRFTDPPRHVQQGIRCRLLLLPPLEEVQKPRSQCPGLRLLQDAPKVATRSVPELVSVDRYDPVSPFPKGLASQIRSDTAVVEKALIAGPPHPGVLLAQLPQHPVGPIGGAVVNDKKPIKAQREMVEDVSANDVHLVASY